VYADYGEPDARRCREIIFGNHNTRSAESGEQLANARLIAAAPDMLAALELALPHIAKNAFTWSDGDSPETYHGRKLYVTDTIAALIAKARGR